MLSAFFFAILAYFGHLLVNLLVTISAFVL